MKNSVLEAWFHNAEQGYAFFQSVFQKSDNCSSATRLETHDPPHFPRGKLKITYLT